MIKFKRIMRASVFKFTKLIFIIFPTFFLKVIIVIFISFIIVLKMILLRISSWSFVIIIGLILRILLIYFIKETFKILEKRVSFSIAFWSWFFFMISFPFSCIGIFIFISCLLISKSIFKCFEIIRTFKRTIIFLFKIAIIIIIILTIWIIFILSTTIIFWVIFPEIIKSTGDIKTVNYNGLIGLLIESVKNQQEQINMLRKEIEDMKR